MKSGWIYIVLIAMNISLVIVLMTPTIQNNEVFIKVVQVCIVIVTFILFRMYLKERGFLKDKK